MLQIIFFVFFIYKKKEIKLIDEQTDKLTTRTELLFVQTNTIQMAFYN